MRYDLIVLGGGSGGLAIAKRAALRGAKVALLEQDKLGGTCVHRGCIPKKILRYAARSGRDLQEAGPLGYAPAERQFAWQRLKATLDSELQRLLGFYDRGIDESTVTLIRSRGRLSGPHTVQAGTETLEAERICLAVGGRPFTPPFPGCELAMTSDDVFTMKSLPRRWVVQGSGYIGVELASILAGLGCEVTLIFRSKMLLPKFDPDLRSALQAALQVKVLPETHVEKLSPGLVAHTNHGDLECDAFLAATGRKANTEGLGLEEVGVELDESSAVKVNGWQSSVPSIYAIGDCSNEVQLTPYAISEGRALAERLYGSVKPDVPSLITTAVFALPAAASVGVSEDESCEVFKTTFRPMRHALVGIDEKVFMKLVVRKSDRRVVGIHMVGEDAPEIIQSLAVAMTAGATKEDFDNTLALHPTVAEEFVLLR